MPRPGSARGVEEGWERAALPQLSSFPLANVVRATQPGPFAPLPHHPGQHPQGLGARRLGQVAECPSGAEAGVYCSLPPGCNAQRRYCHCSRLAANRRGSLPVGPSHSLPPLRRPSPLLGKERAQLPARDLKARLLPRQLITAGDPFLLSAFSLSRSADFQLSPKTTCKITQLVPCFPIPLGSSKRLDKKKKKSWGGGGKRVLFLCLAPAPSQCQAAVLDEIRNQGQGPSPGPRRSHRAQAKVQSQLTVTCPTHTLLITKGKRN